MLMALIALSAGAQAQAATRTHKAGARKSACPPPAGPHSKRTGHVCTTSKHAGSSHHSAKHHHSAGHAVKKTGPVAPAAATRVAASCEDGSAPLRAGGTFSCADGSEPACQDGSTPVSSSDRSTLLCPSSKAGAETGCEDISNPECTFGGSEGEAACEGAGASPAADGEVVSCELGDEPACEGAPGPGFSAGAMMSFCEGASTGAAGND
jgi:hypothetical protein